MLSCKQAFLKASGHERLTMHTDTLAIEVRGVDVSKSSSKSQALFPHTASFDHFGPELHQDDEGISSESLAKFGEYVPVLSTGIQALHELSGNEEALARARKADPLGSDGVLTSLGPLLSLVFRS